MYECVYVYTYGCTYVYVCAHIQTHNFIEKKNKPNLLGGTVS